MATDRNTWARASVYYHFLLEGSLVGVWASQLFWIRDDEGMSDSVLGFCVLFSYLGTVVASPISGFLVRFMGSKRTTILGGILYVFCLGAMAFVTGVPLLCISFFAFGFFMVSKYLTCMVPVSAFIPSI